jgi:hypothetical protein
MLALAWLAMVVGFALLGVTGAVLGLVAFLTWKVVEWRRSKRPWEAA